MENRECGQCVSVTGGAWRSVLTSERGAEGGSRVLGPGHVSVTEAVVRRVEYERRAGRQEEGAGGTGQGHGGITSCVNRGHKQPWWND